MMRRRDFLVGAVAAAVVPDGGAVLTPAAVPTLRAAYLDAAHRVANPPLVRLADGRLRTMSTAAQERAFRMIDRLIGDDRPS